MESQLVPIHGGVAADALGGISRSKLYELLDSGELERVHIGVRAFVTRRSINAYIDRLLAASA